MNTEEIFKRLGLGKHTAIVYECLANNKTPLSVSVLATNLNISRMSVYRCLDELLEKQFVSTVTVGKRTQYAANSPRKIYKEFNSVLNEVKNFTEEKALKREKELPGHVQYFTGASGIRAVFDDVITHTPRGETFYRYTSEKNLSKVNRYLSPGYRKNRDKKRLERLVISNPLSGTQKRSRLERFIKYIPSGVNVFDQNIIQLIYGSRLAFINLTKEEAFIIEDKPLSGFQKTIFTQLYRKLN